MIEAAAEGDDELHRTSTSKAATLTDEEIKRGLRARAIKNEIVLCMCGTAFKNKGVQALLDAIIEFMPSPIEMPAVKGPNDRRRADHAQGQRRRAVRGAGVQDPERSVRRQPDLLPRLLRHAELGRHGVRADQGQEGAHRAPAADARQRAQRDQGSARRRHRRGRRPQGRLSPATRSAISRRSSRSRRWTFRCRSSRSRWSRRPRPTRRR